MTLPRAALEAGVVVTKFRSKCDLVWFALDEATLERWEKEEADNDEEGGDSC